MTVNSLLNVCLLHQILIPTRAEPNQSSIFMFPRTHPSVKHTVGTPTLKIPGGVREGEENMKTGEGGRKEGKVMEKGRGRGEKEKIKKNNTAVVERT